MVLADEYSLMLHRRQRTVLHYDVTVGSNPAHAPAQMLATVVDQLKDAADKGEAAWLRNKGQAVIRVARARIDNTGTRAVLLLHHANTDASDPSFSIIQTGEIRTAPKLRGEGVAVSAHLFLDLSQAANGTYHALLESVAGLTRSYADAAINSILRKCGEYQFRDLNGAVVSARPKLSFAPRLSESFLMDLAKGRLSSITLLKTENVGDLFDSDPDVRVREATLRLVPNEIRTGKNVVDLVRRVVTQARTEGYTNARFSYTDEQGKSKAPSIAIAKADTFDAFVAKASMFEVEQDLTQCEAEIRADVSKKMNSLLKAHIASLAR